MARLLGLAFLALATVCLPSPLSAQPGAQARAQSPARDDLVLFEVRLDNTVLSESLMAYGSAEDPLLPVGELARMLGLDLTVLPPEGRVVGRVGESLRPVTIDIASGEGRSGGTGVAIEPDDTVVTPTEIFIRASVLQRLLPIDLSSDPDNLTVSVTARETLPVQARKARLDRRVQTDDPTTAGEPALQVATPYRWVSRPGFDFTTETAKDSTRPGFITRFEGRAAGDLLKTGVSAYLASDDRGAPASARVKAERRSARNDLLGPLHASTAAVGDVFAPGLTLGPRSVGGAGFAVSSTPLEEANVFERINLRGELPLGFDVELYVNDILRASQSSAALGRYEFLDVPLVRGINVIRVVSYGPRGEREEETRVVNVGGGQVPSGSTVFSAGLVFQDRPVFDLSKDGFASSLAARGKPRAVLALAHGLTPSLTVELGGAAYTDQNGDDRRIVSTGLRTSLAGVATQLGLAQDVAGGSAASLGLAGRVAGVSFIGRHAEYANGFADENVAFFDPGRRMRRHSELTVDLTVPFLARSRLPISARVERTGFADGGSSFVARGRTTLSVADTLVAAGLDYQQRSDRNVRDHRFTATLAASRLVHYNWQLRAAADIDISPDSQLRSLTFSADHALSDRHSLRLGLATSFGAFDDLTAQFGLTSRMPFGDASLIGDYSTGQERWRVGLQFNFGLAYDPATRSFRLTPPGPASGASASFQAFRDANANGIRDPGEEPVPGIRLLGGSRKAVTGRDGRIFVTGLGEGPSGMLRAETGEVDTLFAVTPPAAIGFAPRAGYVLDIPYPIVPASEVGATIRLRQPDGTLSGLAAVRLRLVPKDGAAITGSTEFDGTAVFALVLPGDYKLELDPEQAKQLRMRLVAPVSVNVGSEGGSVRVDGEVAFAEGTAQ